VAKEKAPAFQFYPRDFLGDSNVAVMTAEQVGAYWLLLCYCWIDHTLPMDRKKLASLARIHHLHWDRVWSAIGHCFQQTDEGYIHPRLEREREKQQRHSSHMSAAGARGAAKRWPKPGHGQAIAKPQPDGSQAIAPDSSSSSSSSSEEKERALKTQLPPQGINPKPKPNPNIVNPGDPVELVRWQFDEFVKRATPAFKADAWARVDAWVRKVGESTRAKGETVTAPSKDWWAARFARDFARSTQPKANALAPDADYREWYQRTQLQQQKDDAA
jgi:uncharacterized protein YdaU (DUF1376 family)